MNFTQNKKALEAVSKTTNQIYSYLEADTRKPQYNHIVTIPAKDRNVNNGYSNFIFQFLGISQVEKLNVRVETNVFKDIIGIKASKAKDIKNADLIIFFDTEDERLFVSDARLNNNNKWLEDKSIRDITNYEFNGRTKTSYTYNIDSLMKQHAIFEIITDTTMNCLHIIHDSFMSYVNNTVMRLSSDIKTLKNYNISLEHITAVQYDPRDRDTVYYRFMNEEIIERPTTLVALVEYFSAYTTVSKRALYQRLYKAANGKTNRFSVPFEGNGTIDERFLNSKNEIEIVLSTEFQDKKQVKEAKSEDYRNMYRKVSKYKKTHTEPRASWTDEEKELFYKIGGE